MTAGESDTVCPRAGAARRDAQAAATRNRMSEGLREPLDGACDRPRWLGGRDLDLQGMRDGPAHGHLGVDDLGKGGEERAVEADAAAGVEVPQRSAQAREARGG